MMESQLNEILTEVKLLRDDVRVVQNEQREQRVLLEQLVSRRVAAPPRADDLVSVEYVEQKTGLKKRTLLEGRAGTKSLLRQRVRTHPSLWRRGDVDDWVMELIRKKKEQDDRNFRLIKRRRRRFS